MSANDGRKTCSVDQFPVEIKYFPFQAIRLVATVLMFLIPVVAGKNRMGLILMVIFLTFIDTVDCPWNRSYSCDGSVWYQCMDKLIDQMQYMVALAIIWNWPLITPQRRIILIITLMWRWIGVLLFVRSEATEPTWLMLCPDLFKELIVLWACFPNSGSGAIALVIVAKILFECIKGSSIKSSIKPKLKN